MEFEAMIQNSCAESSEKSREEQLKELLESLSEPSHFSRRPRKKVEFVHTKVRAGVAA